MNDLETLSPSIASSENESLYSVAQDLLDKANIARDHGDMETFRKFIRAALDCMTEDDLPKAPSYRGDHGQLAKLRGILADGWQEVETLSQKMGVGTSRIHTLIAKMRRGGEDVQALSFKKYRIPPVESN